MCTFEYIIYYLGVCDELNLKLFYPFCSMLEIKLAHLNASLGTIYYILKTDTCNSSYKFRKAFYLSYVTILNQSLLLAKELTLSLFWYNSFVSGWYSNKLAKWKVWQIFQLFENSSRIKSLFWNAFLHRSLSILALYLALAASKWSFTLAWISRTLSGIYHIIWCLASSDYGWQYNQVKNMAWGTCIKNLKRYFPTTLIYHVVLSKLNLRQCGFLIPYNCSLVAPSILKQMDKQNGQLDIGKYILLCSCSFCNFKIFF